MSKSPLPKSWSSAATSFFKQTGIRIYFTSTFDDEDKVRYLRHFNRLLQEKLRRKSSPYILVNTHLAGNSKQGYNVAVSITGSEELKLRKYDLDKTDNRNPFWGVVQTGISGREEFARTIRQGLFNGIDVLSTKVKGDFLPPLLISYRGEWYKSGEVIEVSGGKDLRVKLYAINRDGAPAKAPVTWSFSPNNAQSQQAVINGNQLDFPVETGGEYSITAASNGDQVNVTLKIIDVATSVDNILEQLLLEVLAPILVDELATQKKLKEQEGQTLTDAQTSIANLEKYNYPIEEGSNTLTPLQETPYVLNEQEEEVFNADAPCQ